MHRTSTTNNNPNMMHSVISSTASHHLNKYSGQFARVESVLEGRPLIDEYVTLIATKTGLRKAYIILGGAVLALMFLIFGPIAKLFGSLIGVTYPAYKSIKAVENPSREDDRQWLTYWVVFAFFSVARNFSGFILSWFPFYNLVELGVLLWMMAPIRRNGSHFLYQTILRPFVLKHIDTIDSTINSVTTSFGVPNTDAAKANSEPIGSTANAAEAAEVSNTSSVQLDGTSIESLKKLEAQEGDNTGAATLETITEVTEQKQE